MSKFRKMPVVIEARLFETNNEPDGSPHMDALCAWMNEGRGEASRFELPHHHNGTAIFICTLEGTMTAEVGDWIVKGVKGEFYPCKPDIFVATYELVE